MYLKKKKNITNYTIMIMEYIIAILLLVSANSIYIHDYIHLHLKILLAGVLILYLIVILKSSKIKNTKICLKKYYKYFAFYYLYAVLFMILNGSFVRNYISVFLVVLPLFVFVYLLYNSNHNILDKFLNLVIIISCLSIAFYLILDVFKLVSYPTIIKINWGTIRYIPSFFGLHFSTQTINIFGHEISRNTGVFTEAPMFSLVLTLALAYYEFLYSNKIDNRVRFLLIITIITTFSTIGYISTIFIYIMSLSKHYYIKFKETKKIWKYTSVLVLIVLFLSCIWLFSAKLNTNSGSIRVDDYKACYKTWIQHGVLLGAGFNNEDAIIENMSDFRKDNQGLSNSTMVVLAEGGIVLFMIFLIPFILSIYYAVKNKCANIAFYSLITFFLFCTTIFCYTPLMINILANGYYLILREKNNI